MAGLLRRPRASDDNTLSASKRVVPAPFTRAGTLFLDHKRWPRDEAHPKKVDQERAQSAWRRTYPERAAELGHVTCRPSPSDGGV